MSWCTAIPPDRRRNSNSKSNSRPAGSTPPRRRTLKYFLKSARCFAPGARRTALALSGRLCRRPRLDLQGLLDGRGADPAGDLVLRAGPPGAADRADQLASLYQRDPAARSDDPVERHHIVEIALLNGVLEHLAFATESRGSARLVLGDPD